MNNLYEYGGSCDVIIRCNGERTIGGKTYKAGEPYTILENVFCSLQYKNTLSDTSAKNNILATRIGMPDYVNISNVSLKDKITHLIAEQIPSQKIGHFCYCEAQNGIIWLPEKPLANNIYVYHQGNLITGWTLEEECLMGQDTFVDFEEYLIVYNTEAKNPCFDFTTPVYGYFSLEIIGKGNNDKISDQIYINIPAVSLMSVPIFDLVNGNILNVPLQFQCIHQNQQKPYFNVGE